MLSHSYSSSHRLAEVPDRLEARVDRGQPDGHGAGQGRDGGYAAGDLTQSGADGPEMKDHSQQADGGDADDQRADDQSDPRGCGHGVIPSTQPSSLATEPAYLTAPTATS